MAAAVHTEAYRSGVCLGYHVYQCSGKTEAIDVGFYCHVIVYAWPRWFIIFETSICMLAFKCRIHARAQRVQ